MSDNPHFETVPSWDAAEARLTFHPLAPAHTAGYQLASLRIHVRDHKMRDVPIQDRTLEANYGGFVLTQSRKGEAEARRLALDVSYGQSPRDTHIAGHAARAYEQGPEPAPDDIDGRLPAVVTWHDAEMFFLIASHTLDPEELIRIASSLYR
jgi:hypothetical protein